ncbi:MAG: alpha/beta hydrolase [Clostridia bacterium]
MKGLIDMELFLLIILSIVLFIFCSRYIVINEKSLTGILFCKMISFTTLLFKNHNRLLLEQYKKINKENVWKVKEKTYRNYSIKKIDILGLTSYLLTPKKDTNGKIILQLHGGGYEKDLLNHSLYLARTYFKFTKTFEILTINYRVAPKNPFPAALDDCILAYNWLLENGYKSENIVFAGDSAGGGLCLATIMKLRDDKYVLPRAVITMSAWTNLTNTQSSFKDNFNIDPVFGKMNDSLICISTYAKGQDKTNPYISPYFGSFAGFPDMLLQVGSLEMLLSDTVDIAIKAKKCGVKVTQTTYYGMFHVFERYVHLLPEAKEAWLEIKFFLEDIFTN